MMVTVRYALLACLASQLWAGQTYVAAGTATLIRISADGTSVSTINNGVIFRDLAQEPTGNYVGAAVNKIQRVTPTGIVTTVAAAPAGSQFISLAVDGSGNIIVADNQLHVLWKITPDGLSVTQIGSYPVLTTDELEDVYVRVDSSGNYILANDNSSSIKLYKITPQGLATPIPLAGNYAPVQLAGLTLDSVGNYYVADSGPGRILKVASNGIFATIASGSVLSPRVYGLAYNSLTNEVIASVPAGGKFVKIAPDGSVVTPVSIGTANSSILVDYGTGPVTPGSALRFIPVTPCRVADTRTGQGTVGAFGPPTIAGGASRSFPISSSSCNIPATAQAYALNLTVLPQGPLSYLTLWPSGQPQPNVSTLNSPNGKVLANAAIVPAGLNGGVSVYVTNTTDVIIDINGYFDTPTATNLGFFPTTPCRVADTRNPNGTFGGPQMFAGQTRDFPVPASTCGLPAGAQAYSLNATVVPPGPLSFLTLWPSGLVKPFVSTLNSPDGRVLANAAIVPAGAGTGSVSAYVTNASDLILDANGYFGTAAGGLSFYPVMPCRVADTRLANGPFGGPILAAATPRDFVVPASACSIPASARAYSVNVTVVPSGPLSYLTIWPTGQGQPFVSTLNSGDGSVLANAAIVPNGTSGAVTVYATNPTHLVLDINGYFAP